MPGWLTAVLKWGGVVLTILAAIALLYVEFLTPAPAEGTTTAPLTLYWVLLVIGLAAAIIGVGVDRRKTG
jgi:hypothetical protein